MSTQIGVDTLGLSLEDYKLKQNLRLELHQGAIDIHSGHIAGSWPLGKLPNGHELNGSKLVGNFDVLNIDIKPFAGEIKAFVRLSLPKFKAGGEDNFKPVPQSEISEVLEAVECTLEGIGIETKIDQAKITRLDSFSNLKLKHNFSDYEPLFSGLTASRKKSLPFVGEGYLYRNKTEQFCLYDKGRQMKEKLGQAPPPGNNMRIEHRMMKSRKIESKLGAAPAGKLKDRKFYTATMENFKDTVSKQLLNKSLENIPLLSTEKIIESLLNFKSAYNRNWIQKWTEFHAFRALAKQTNFESLIVAIEAVSDNRMQASRIRKKFQSILVSGKSAGGAANIENLNLLYNEIKTKFTQSFLTN